MIICNDLACNAAKVNSVTVSTMPVSEALAHLSDMADSNRGESWTAAVLGKHVGHATGKGNGMIQCCVCGRVPGNSTIDSLILFSQHELECLESESVRIDAILRANNI